MEDVCIETFCEKLAPRVAIKSGVVNAYEPEPVRVLGLHWMVWVGPAILAAVLMVFG